MQITQQDLDDIETGNRRLNARLTDLEQRLGVIDAYIRASLLDIREAQLKLQHALAAITLIPEGR